MFSLLIFLKPKLSLPIVSGWLLLTLGLFLLKTFSSFEVNHLYLIFLFSRYNLEFIFGVIAAYLVYKIRFKIKVNQAFLVLNLGVIFFALCCIFFNPSELINIRIIAYGISSMLIILGAALVDLIAP
jgi:peptidoglycan/LPS O-acetylase OafA/YrhL